MRGVIGVMGRLVFWMALLFIVGNSAAYSFHHHEAALGVAKLVFFPATFLIWPFVAPAHASRWPLALGDGVFLIALGVALVGYWISTFIGRMNPVE